jgi:hypothetical protein
MGYGGGGAGIAKATAAAPRAAGGTAAASGATATATETAGRFTRGQALGGVGEMPLNRAVSRAAEGVAEVGLIGAAGLFGWSLADVAAGLVTDRKAELGERSARLVLQQLDAKARTVQLTMEEEQARQALRRRFEGKGK